MTGEAKMQTNEQMAQREMPKYRSHKEVHALKMAKVAPSDVAFGFTRFTPAESGYAEFEHANSDEVVKRCRATEMGDPGYVVVYSDGFRSWSPTKAFEDGYTRL